jgi:hypothetical protein
MIAIRSSPGIIRMLRAPSFPVVDLEIPQTRASRCGSRAAIANYPTGKQRWLARSE